jgi:hypothetical protein
MKSCFFVTCQDEKHDFSTENPTSLDHGVWGLAPEPKSRKIREFHDFIERIIGYTIAKFGSKIHWSFSERQGCSLTTSKKLRKSRPGFMLVLHIFISGNPDYIQEKTASLKLLVLSKYTNWNFVSSILKEMIVSKNLSIEAHWLLLVLL